MKTRERELAAPRYIEGQKSLDEIAAELKISPRTLRDWKDKDGWEKKRKDFIAISTGSVERCQRMIAGIEREIEADKRARRKTSTSRLYALRGFQKTLLVLMNSTRKESDKIPAPGEKKKLPPVTIENFLKIEREEFGIYADANRN